MGRRRSTLSWLDPLFLLRPVLMIPVWTAFLAGYGGGSKPFNWPGVPSGDGCILLASVTLILGGVYIFNQIQDRDTDRINCKLFLLSEGAVGVGSAYVEAGFVTLLGLILGFLHGMNAGWLVLILAVLGGWMYNYPPFSGKNRPFFGPMINGAGGLLVHRIGLLAAGREDPLCILSAAYFLAGAAVALLTTLPDLEGDARTNKITFGVRFGIRKSAFTALFLEIAATVIALVLRDWILACAGAVLFPFFLLTAIGPRISIAARTARMSVILLALSVSVWFPVYAVWLAVVVIFTRIYHQKRFGLAYPAIGG